MLASLPTFVRSLAARHASPRTIKIYTAVITAFSSFLERDDGDDVPPLRAEIEAFLARAREDGGVRSAATRNQELAALRAFAKLGVRELGWTARPTDDIPLVREPPHDPPVLSTPELRRLFTIAAEETRPGERARNLAVLALLSQTGLRVHELVALDLDQLDLASATLLGVKGKGGTIHDLPLNAPAVALLAAWLGERSSLAQEGESALFLSPRGKRLSIRAIQRMMRQLRAAMGTAKRITPHCLRHTAATIALTMGTDLSTVAELLRHTDLNTTRRYLHLVDTRRREAVAKLSVTVPESVLPRAASYNSIHGKPLEIAGKAALQESTEGAESSPRFPLDVQRGLSTPSPPNPPALREPDTNASRTPFRGACFVSRLSHCPYLASCDERP